MSLAPSEQRARGSAGLATPSKPQVFLAAFGKHPGWSDFMDDIGMETETLIAAKRMLYVKGIASQIETGAWARLEPEKRVPDFNHVFLWRQSEEFLVGRIWSSADAKGRKEYPMVACADCIELPLFRSLQELLPKLDEVRTACQAARSAGEVSAIMSQAQNAIRERMADSSKLPLDDSDARTAHARFLGRREWGPNQEGLYRILHQMRGQLSAYGMGRSPSLTDTIFLRKTASGEASAMPQQIRVPQVADTPAEALWQWNEFFVHKLDAAVLVLLVLNLDRHWLDITLGEPTNQEFFSLKASQAALPLASEVPYELDEESRAFAADFIASYGAQSPDEGKDTSATSRVAVGLALLLILMTLFAGYLHFAPAAYIPDILHGAAGKLGNPAFLPSPKS